MPVKWVKNSVKFTATPDYPNAIYTSGQTYSLVTILEVDE